MTYGKIATKQMAVVGASANFPETNYLVLEQGRFFNDFEVTHRREVVVLGYAPAETLFKNIDPIGKKDPDRPGRVHGRRRHGQAAEPDRRQPGRVRGHPDHHLRQAVSAAPVPRDASSRFLMIAVVPYPGAPQKQILAEVEQVMRSRHRLKLDEENDFDLLTSDIIMKIFDQLTRAVFLALVVIS